jgi:hypothetical protein
MIPMEDGLPQQDTKTIKVVFLSSHMSFGLRSKKAKKKLQT